MNDELAVNSKLQKVILAIASVFMLLGLMGCFYVVTSTSVAINRYAAIFSVVEIIVAAVYTFLGFKKDGNKALRALFVTGALSILIDTLLYFTDINSFLEDFSPIVVCCELIIFGNLVLLAFGKDLGKAASLTLTWTNFVIYASTLVYVAIQESNNIERIIIYVTWTVLAGLAVLLVQAKYIDKDNRKTV